MTNRTDIRELNVAGGAPGQMPAVNAAGTALEYVDPPTGGGGGSSGGGGISVLGRMTRTADVSVTSGGQRKITFTTEAQDVGASVDLANSRFVVPADALYRLSAALHWSAQVPDAQLFAYVNGEQFGNLMLNRQTSQNAIIGSLDLLLAAGDTVELYAVVSSTVNLRGSIPSTVSLAAAGGGINSIDGGTL